MEAGVKVELPVENSSEIVHIDEVRTVAAPSSSNTLM